MHNSTIAYLSTTYFGPVQWYQKLYRYDHVLIEANESFQKQTYRNRCLIATAQGIQALTVPVKANERLSNNIPHLSSLISNLRISDHGNWRHQHWQAITSAYGDSPFFEYYEDDLRPFFFEHKWEYLLDFNEEIRRKMCELLDIHPNAKHTAEFIKQPSLALPETNEHRPALFPVADFRDAIRPKNPAPDSSFTTQPYYQVFAQRHGFLPNLSILDLLLNMGPESIFFL